MDGLPGLDEAGDEGCLHLGHGIVDRHAGAFVQDLDAEDLHGRGCALFVGAGQGDVERQDLVGVPGFGFFLHAADGRHDGIHLIDGGAGGLASLGRQ